MTDLLPSARTPAVFARGGEAFASSRAVATFFGKNHRDVMRAIDQLVAQEPQLTPAQFCAGVYTLPETGPQQHRCFDMNRDGFMLLAMGFTGAAALKWKLRYIDAFNAMEAELRKGAADVSAMLNDPAALRGLLTGYSERVLSLQGEVAELKPQAEALERISGSAGSLCITDAAKTLKVPPRELFRFMRSKRWIYARHGTGQEVAYQDKLDTGLLEHKTTTVQRTGGGSKTITQIRVTSKGLTRLARDVQTAPQLI